MNGINGSSKDIINRCHCKERSVRTPPRSVPVKNPCDHKPLNDVQHSDKAGETMGNLGPIWNSYIILMNYSKNLKS